MQKDAGMRTFSGILLVFIFLAACTATENTNNSEPTAEGGKIVIYQVFTRLFGNKDTTWKPWGTIEENGVGKFNDFTDTALAAIRQLGITHIWYTGVPHHAVIRDYSAIGISDDDPDVVKGRAGSPYAVKDYYNVNPDLATDPAKRLEEFKSLIERTHKNGMKVIIDIVPNHVARQYISQQKPDSAEDFGTKDDRNVEYNRDNSFYYIQGEAFKVPASKDSYKPLGGAAHPLSDGKFEEIPAKWTGNGSRLSQPKVDDWYETIKVNYGIRPDGVKDFDTLPASYASLPVEDHNAFWANKKVPATWKKFRDIALFWLDLGVDGFRFDMAEMVPVEFWSYMNAAIKMRNKDATLIAEIYNPSQYRNYIKLGKMDYLYDKVEMYDTLRNIIQGNGSTDNLVALQNGMADIEHHMLHFLENHDEQRIASPGFAGDPAKAKPAMVVSALISSSPTLVYFGQELGEEGNEDAGYGNPTRTSIFDYIGVPTHQRWMNGGKFDGGLLTQKEKDLQKFYSTLLNFTKSNNALMGDYEEIHRFNRQQNKTYSDKQFSFVRWSADKQLIVFSNFSNTNRFTGELLLPDSIIKKWKLVNSSYNIKDELTGRTATLKIRNGLGYITIDSEPLESMVFSIQ